MRATAAHLWFHAEEPERALNEVATGLSEIGPTDFFALAALYGQRAYIWFRLNENQQGLADTEHALLALEELTSEEQLTWRARVLTNRGLFSCYAGHHEEARRDLEDVLALSRQGSAEVLVAQTLHNLGFAAARRGDLPEALSRYDEALLAYLHLGLPLHQLFADKAELLTTARLIPEARQAAADAASAFERAGLGAEAAEALVTLAEACLADGDLEAAESASEQAAESFSRQRRSSWVVRAEQVGEKARRRRLAVADDRAGLRASLASSAAALAAAGWEEDSWQACVELARLGLAEKRHDLMSQATAHLPAPGRERPLRAQSLLGHARGLDLVAKGQVKAGLAALEEAMELAFVEASELKALTGQLGHGQRLADLLNSAVAVLLAEGPRPEVMFEWVEWARSLANAPTGASPERQSAGRLLTGLGDDLLVEMLVHERRLLALVGDRERLDLIDLGPMAPLEKATASIHLAVGELVQTRRPTNRRAMAELFKRSVEVLETALAPALDSVAGGSVRLRLVPAGPLHDLAWCLLPSLFDRPVCITSSAKLSQSPGRPDGAVLLVAGPELSNGEAEVEAIASAYEGRETVRLSGAAANRQNVLSHLPGASTVHLAVHGRFRADNPFLSSFWLHDGHLSVLEMALACRRVGPACVVLSACDAGRVISHASEELAGPVPGLLGFEGGSVVAPLSLVGDAAMAGVATELHKALAGGKRPEEALLTARLAAGSPAEMSASELELGGESVAAALSAGVLVCHGGSPPSGSPPSLLGESMS